MIEDIMAGIAAVAEREWGCSLYSDEQLQQPFQKPGCHVGFLGMKETPRLYPRFYREQSFDIRYFPENAENEKDMHLLAERLYSALDIIEGPGGDRYRGTGLWHEIKEGVLHVYVNYNIHVYRPFPEEIKMEEAQYVAKSQSKQGEP